MHRLYEPAEIHMIKATDSIGFEEHIFGDQYLNDTDRRRLNKADKHISPTLLLAKNCKIVITKNISQYMKQINGTQGIFEGFVDDRKEIL